MGMAYKNERLSTAASSFGSTPFDCFNGNKETTRVTIPIVSGCKSTPKKRNRSEILSKAINSEHIFLGVPKRRANCGHWVCAKSDSRKCCLVMCV